MHVRSKFCHVNTLKNKQNAMQITSQVGALDSRISILFSSLSCGEMLSQFGLHWTIVLSVIQAELELKAGRVVVVCTSRSQKPDMKKKR